MKTPFITSFTASALFLAAASNFASAATLTWDTAAGDGSAITAGSGNWNTTAGNTVWNNGSTNAIWSQTSTSAATNAAVFGGADGTYTVTIASGATMNAQSVTFNNSGYAISGGTLALRPTSTTSGSITVAESKTATISSLISYSNNATANITVNSGATLNLGGGASNSQYQFIGGLGGAGTVNMTAGTYAANVGNTAVVALNQSGGTFNITPGSGTAFNISSNARNVAYNLTGGTLTLNGQSGVTGSHLGIGNNTTTAYTATMNVEGGTMNVGTTSSRAGEIQIAKNASSNGTLNVSSGTLTVGTGSNANKIYFFKNGSAAGFTTNMTQSGGTVTTNGIQFGGSTGATTYDATSSANLTLSGGDFYIGAQGMTTGSDAGALPINIKLQGGTIGASASWSSSLDMKLGDTNGGPVFQAATSGGTATDITLSGVLSDDDSASGTLTKTGAGKLTLSGANTYSGETIISAGTLELGASDVLPDARAVSIGAATLDAAIYVDAMGTLDVTGAATINLGAGAALVFDDSSAVDWTGGSLNITGTFVSGSSLRFGTTNTGLTADQLNSITMSGFSNFALDGDGFLTAGAADSTPPTLTSIVDNKDGGPIAVNTLVTYTVTFSEAINAAMVTADDFDNAGTAGITIGTIAETSAGVFTVQVTPTSAGTLILQIPTTATINDAYGNALVCDPALPDDTTIEVNTASAPTLADIVDDKSGQQVAPGMMVTYTLTFSEDMDDTTITADDFDNAGTAGITIGTISETSAGVFTVQVTPSNIGTIRLRIKADAVIRAASNNVMDTTSAILDDTTLTVGNYLFWDTDASDGSAITSGSGTWDTTVGNTVWNSGAANVIWSQASGTLGSNEAVFGGADGTADQHVVTLGGATAAKSLIFNSSGYKITGSTISVITSGSTNGNITVAAGKTATINSYIGFIDNKATTFTVNSGAALNLGGGAFNSQYTFAGAGTVNMTAGTYEADVGKVNVPTFNQSGGIFNMVLPSGSSNNYSIGNAAGRNVTYTLSGGTINARGNNSGDVNPYLGIGRNANNTAYSNILNVQGTGTLNIGSASRAGELLIASTANSNGTLNVLGGTVTVNSSNIANKIYFFKNGSSAGYAASMTQSGGTVTANGIQFGGTTGTYDATSSADLTLSGGNLYIGLQGITRGSAAGSLPITIRLQGGTIGASDNWSSSLDMKIGAITIRGGTPTSANNITLSGVLSDDSSAGTLTKTGSGTLTLSGSNSYTGATLVNGGTLVLGNANAVSTSSSLTISDGAGLALTNGPSTVPTLTFSGAGALSLDVASGCVLTVSTADGVTNSGAEGSIAINITGGVPASGTYTLIDYDGALQGTGYSAFTLGTTPTGKMFSLAHDSVSGAVQLVVQDVFNWTGAQSSEWSTNVIDGLKNWTQDGVAVDYINAVPVYFDIAASNKTVEITGTDIAPHSVTFNGDVYTLQGSNTFANTTPVTVVSGATLKLGSSNLLPDGAGAGIVTVNGTLDLNGNSETINGLSGTGSVDNTASGTTSTLTVGSDAIGTIEAAIQNTVGTLALTKTGSAGIILTGANTYSGATTINQGRLLINSSASLPTSTAVSVNNGASLVLNASGTPAFAQSITLNSGSNLSLRMAATLSNVTLATSGSLKFNYDDVATQALTLSSAADLSGALTVEVGGSHATIGAVSLTGILSGTGGSLVKTGPGALSLTGANTFDGGVAIKNGTLESKTTQFTLGTGTVTMGGAGSAGATFITGQSNSNPFVIDAPDSGNIVIGANGAGSGFVMSGGVTLNGNLTLQTFNNTVPVAPATTKASVTLTGGVTGTGNLLLNNLGLAANVITFNTAAIDHTGSITLQGSATGATTINSAIGSNVTGITQNSATSPLILNGANTYACDLTVNAGVVTIADNTNTANDVSTVSIATGAALNLTYVGTDTVRALIIGGVEQAPGVYGAVGSEFPVTGVAEITGTGTLTVGEAEIAVELDGADLASGSTQDFGSVVVGETASLTFTIRNTGNIDLNLTGDPDLIAITGADAADFTVSAAPSASLVATDTTTFTIDFIPSAEGARSAQLSIASNDNDENPFVINLGGTGSTSAADPYTTWSGGAAFDADANGDGVSNGLAWILGAADANADARSLLPSASVSSSNLVYTFKRAQASIDASVALTVEVGTTLSAWSSTYTVGAESADSSEGVAITKDSPSAGTDTVTVTIPRGADTKKFARLKAVQTP